MEMTESYTNRTSKAAYGKVCTPCILYSSYAIDRNMPHPLYNPKVKLAFVVHALKINLLCLENGDFSL